MNSKRMKVLALFVGLFLITISAKAAYSLEWKNANQVTILWDATTTMDDGTPVNDTVYYKVYRKIIGAETYEEIPTDLLTATSFVVTFTVEGSYALGVSAYRLVEGVVAYESSISWSDDSEATNGLTFGIRYYLSPSAPGGLRVQ